MRRFELGDRWWSIVVLDQRVQIVWGKAGGAEQRIDRTLASTAAAVAYRDMQIAKQREHGYVEVQAAPPPEAPNAVAPAVDEAPVERSVRFEIKAEEKTSYRRYPKPARFYEVIQRDRMVIEWSGPLELADDPDASKRTEETFESIASASDAFTEAVQTAREEGWRQIQSSSVVEAKTEPDLEAQCWSAGDDPAPWSVYADWLLEQGDPLGELATCRSDNEAYNRFAAELEHLGIASELVTMERRHGFPRRAGIKPRDVDESDPITLADAARAVRSCTLGRFVDELRFGLAGYTDRNDWAPTLRALAEAPHPERIRELRFDDYEYTDCEISWAAMGDLGGLFAPFTGLEVLHLKSGAGGDLGELALPNLKTFIRESGGLAATEIESICNAAWPKLEHLEIWFGSGNYGAQGTVATIRSILDGRGLPALRHLGIVNCEFVEDAIDALAHSKILAQLSSLDLSKGVLARRGAALFEQHAAAFRHLASIDLSSNCLDAEQIARIRAVLDNVIVIDQREIDEDDYEEVEAEEGALVRYVAVGE